MPNVFWIILQAAQLVVFVGIIVLILWGLYRLTKDEDIDSMDTTTPIRTGPKDFFLNLLGVATLYASVVFTLVLLFQYVNVKLPVPGQQSYLLSNALDLIRVASSVLIVVFPTFLIIAWLVGKDLRVQPEKRNVRIRKWLTYFTLFLTAITIIVDLIILVYNFYNGDLTSRFALKVISVLIIAGVVFWYYMWDLRRAVFDNKKTKLFAWIAGFAVLVCLVSGFFIAGSPATQRAIRLDEQRISDLQNIQSQIVSYWQAKDKLPADLSQLKNDINGQIVPVDPRTAIAYGYAVKGPLSFELCVMFEHEGDSSGQLYTSSSSLSTVTLGFTNAMDNWKHSVGKTCFTRTIDPDYYKNQPQTISPIKY